MDKKDEANTVASAHAFAVLFYCGRVVSWHQLSCRCDMWYRLAKCCAFGGRRQRCQFVRLRFEELEVLGFILRHGGGKARGATPKGRFHDMSLPTNFYTTGKARKKDFMSSYDQHHRAPPSAHPQRISSPHANSASHIATMEFQKGHV